MAPAPPDRTRPAGSSFSGLVIRLSGADKRAREAIVGHVGSDLLYGLHAIEVTLANSREDPARHAPDRADAPKGKQPAARDLAWAAIRTAPERIVRQTGPAHPLAPPHVSGRLPPFTLVVMNMRRSDLRRARRL
ncbi:MAG: hypothetical protein R3D67_22525 [Hyphomicrobiaceae bacterium]